MVKKLTKHSLLCFFIIMLKQSRYRFSQENATQMRHELGQSSEYPVRTGVGDCYYYLKNGGCFFGRSCRYNHPPVSVNTNKEYLTESVSRLPYVLLSLKHLPQRNQLGDDTVQPSAYKVRLGATNCEQYLHTGQCTYGSRCWFNHPPVSENTKKRVFIFFHWAQVAELPHGLLSLIQLPGARDCEQYLQTGQCSYGRRCRFNHPLTHLAPVRKKSNYLLFCWV